MSVNACTSYKEASFTNKEYYWSENNSITADLMSKYIMDREYKQFGLGGGIGLNVKLTKHIFIGNELLFQLCQVKTAYTVKARQQPYSNKYVPLAQPYHYSDNDFSSLSHMDFVINLKITYCL